MSFLENTRKPAGLGGKVMVRMMNLGHRALSSWALSFLPALKDGAVLDCGKGQKAFPPKPDDRFDTGRPAIFMLNTQSESTGIDGGLVFIYALRFCFFFSKRLIARSPALTSTIVAAHKSGNA